MTLMEFFGCTFIAFGPPLAMFVFTIARDPLRVIVLIAGAFFWLLALLISSILWYAVVPLQNDLAFGLVFSVIFQELFRFLFYKLLRRADEGLQKVSQTAQTENVTPKDISNKHIMAYVSGLGFGIMCGAFSLINVLADMVGPGTIGIHGDSHLFFLTSGKYLLTFYPFDDVLVFQSLLNERTKHRPEPLYLASTVPAYFIMILMAVVAFFMAGGSLKNVQNAFKCRKGRYEME
ncbi:gamma-secretase subunit Aph-1-like [Haliotis rubra]|uniref:gamma-secretase subunit Aph-1-like n=1 Tax=Haliotis rubra TaxID=36100 RepID=UPI001EE52F00|nr:gamma-secretase subunit Aph-1-like [Haliotis rubra]